MKSLYQKYYNILCSQVFHILKDRIVTEDIVQEVFAEIWKKREELNINQSIEGYLKRACRNRSLNYIRDNKIKWEDDSQLINLQDSTVSTVDKLSVIELEKEIKEGVMTLPEKCGIVFSLSRYEEMSYLEIAQELGISVKTVENQISKALKILREKIYVNSFQT